MFLSVCRSIAGYLCTRRTPVVPGLLLLLIAGATKASTLPLDQGDDLIGQLHVVESRASDTLMDIARAHSVGYWEIRYANPLIDIWLPGDGTSITIPSRFLLPDTVHKGLVLNLSEMRLYYFHSDPDGKPLVTTYPVGIGRADRSTPTGSGQVTMKLHNPTWYPTEDVRADYASRGQTLPLKVPAGPDNPLGEYALVLSLPGYLIHGTNRPDGVGMLVSQGCVRLYPEDIEALVKQVPKGTPFTIVDQPYKVGIADGKLLLEVHPPVYPEQEGDQVSGEKRLIRRIVGLLAERGNELKGRIDWRLVTKVFMRADGIPTVVSKARNNN